MTDTDAPDTEDAVVVFASPGQVHVDTERAGPMSPGTVRVRTWYSGISAGTELSAYRGTNPYLARHWDTDRRVFLDGEPTFAYPLRGWGYSEVGQVVEVGAEVGDLTVGDTVAGIWGHRGTAVVARRLVHRLPAGVEPLAGVFARVGAIALNAVLAAAPRLGETIAVFGQGVIGLLATRLTVLTGADVVAVDASEPRLAHARRFGARHTVAAQVEGGAGLAVRAVSPAGADAAIEVSGSAAALHEAIRSVGCDGTVVAAGFYQGDGVSLRLGEEFHHNRIRLLASQIGGTPTELGARWDHTRLVRTVLELIAAGRLDPLPLVTDVVPVEDVAAAFERLDSGDPTVLQVVLRFPAGPIP